MSRAGHLRVAAVIWLLGACIYLVCEAIAAAGFDGYSYISDYISDLGGSSVMNVGAFMVHGTLLLLGAVVLLTGVLTHGHPKSWVGWCFIVAAATNAVGNILVGTFPSDSAHAHWHGVGAGMAIIGGNVAAIISGIGGGAVGASPALRRACIGLGAFGLVCLAALVVDGARDSRLFEVGLLERGAVYSIIVWELMVGLALLRRAGR